MDDTTLQSQIDAINRKLDIILAEIELQQRHRREMDDLKDDLMRVGRDLYRHAVIELDEVHDHVNTGDMLYLGKKLLRNVNNITKMFEQVENLKDFVTDFSPVSRELVFDLMHKLDEMDRKGYFEFVRQLSRGFDNVVTSFSADDVKALSDNLVTILNTIKSLTQPDMLHAINNAVAVYKNLDVEVEEKVSIFSLIKQINTPEMKRGLAFAIQFLKNLAQQQSQSLLHAPSHTH